MAQSITRADVKEQGWPPLVCICSLCDCGGHKCSDFNDWLAAQDGSSTAPAGDGAGAGSRPAAGLHSHDHSCNYTRSLALNERYLATNSAAGAHQHLSRPKMGQGAAEDGSKELDRSATPAAPADFGPEPEVLHVLVTKPQVASKPRDNIIFEGDMDLRTTFETSYEALAKARLEHWKRHQELEAERQRLEQTGRQDVSDKVGANGQRADAHAGNVDQEGRPESRAKQLSGRDERAAGSTNDVTSMPAENRRPKRGATDALTQHRPTAALIKSPARLQDADQSAESRQLRRPLVFGDELSLESRFDGAGASPQPPAAQLTSEQRRQHQHRRQQDHFIDPDLSPIIVYDANLNRLERVGLRKRSKYRPSTSLRPGGGGFFGPAEGAVERLDEPGSVAAREWSQPSEQIKTGSPVQGERGADGSTRSADRGAAGATSECLNRGQTEGGRKHNHAHVNRIDHIKQMNLVGNSGPERFANSATSTYGDNILAEQLQLSPRENDGLSVGAYERDSNANDGVAEERQLALEEEEAAVAEIQRLVVGNNDYRVAHRVGPAQDAKSLSQQSGRLVKQATIASPSDAANVATQARSPTLSQGDARCASRHSRMERVCQNQSFHLFENDYPEARNGALDERHCIKIGGRETVELSKQLHSRASPQSVYVKQNLFRESPDFTMTTGHTRSRLHSDDGQEKYEHALGRKVAEQNPSTQLDIIKTNEVSADSNSRNNSRADVHKCRVSNLEHEFEFVGSRMGHKYFVEKQVMATPISELD